MPRVQGRLIVSLQVFRSLLTLRFFREIAVISQFFDEIHHLRGLVERLKQDSNVNRNTLIDKPSLLERVNLEDNQDVESEQTMNQEPYDSISKGSQANENLNSSSNIRRTWRGML